MTTNEKQLRKQLVMVQLDGLTLQDKIDILESLCRQVRQKSSIKINNRKFKQMIDERPDEMK